MFKLAKPTGDLAEVLVKIALLASAALLLLAGVLGFYAFSRDPYRVEEVVVARADAVSEFGIAFTLRPNDIFGTVVTYEGRPVPVYLALVQEALVRHTFRLSHGVASGNYSLRVYVAHPDGWTKEVLRYAESFSARSSVSASELLNLTEIRSLMESASKQAGIRLTSYTIVASAVVDYSVTLGPHTRRGSMEHKVELEVDHGRGWIVARGEPSQSKSVTVSTRVVTPVSLAGVPVESLRTLAPSLGVAGVALLTVFAAASARPKGPGASANLERKYRDIIVEGSTLPNLSAAHTVAVRDLEELAKVARLVERPIVRVLLGQGKVAYIVIDRGVAYIVDG